MFCHLIKTFLFLTGIFAPIIISKGQSIQKNQFYCYNSETRPTSQVSTLQPSGNEYSPKGYDITPRGELRVLIVYAGFTNDINQNSPDYSTGNWPQINGVQPDGLTFPNNPGKDFYSNLNQFNTIATDKTLSNFYYQMSQFSGNPFKVIATIFPKRINVTADDYTNENEGFKSYNFKVLEALKSDPATRNFNFSQLDKRSGVPYFRDDNSGLSPDNVIDYTIIIWRNVGIPRGTIKPVKYDNGGFAEVPSVSGIPSADGKTYSTRVGFTHTLGADGIQAPVFIHEFAHSFMSAPHYLNANGVVGNYLYATEGPGMMGYFRSFYSANAWERWYTGWSELTTGLSKVNSDIQGVSSLTATNGEFTLRDFITTGDAMRIQIPGTTQFLWLENHQGKSILDKRIEYITDGQSPAQPFRLEPRGILAMVEDITSSRSSPVYYYNTKGVNGLKVISAQGNFDYTLSNTASTYNNHLWGVQLYNITNILPNPFSGHNQITRLRMDSNGDGNISINQGQGNLPGPPNEGAFSVVKYGQFEDGFLGPDVGFNSVGQKMGNSQNPAIFPLQTFSISTQQLSEIPLNGLSIELLSKNANGDITVKVRYDDITLTNDVRWTGMLRLQDVPASLSGFDLKVSSYKTLTIDKSGTPNRTTKTEANDFINPTKLTLGINTLSELGYGANLIIKGYKTSTSLENGAKLVAGPNSKVTIKNQSLLDIQSGSTLTIQGKLSVEAGATLVIRSGGKLIISGSQSSVDILSGGYACIDPNATIQVEYGGQFLMSGGALNGTNSVLQLSGLNCAPPQTNCPPLTISGTYYCGDCSDTSTKPLLGQNNVTYGTYYITLDPSTATFQPWIFGDSGAIGAYNTNNNRTGVVSLYDYGTGVSVSATGVLGCSNGTRGFRFFAIENDMYSFAPNPTNDQLNVEAKVQKNSRGITESKKEFEAVLYSSYGLPVRSGKSSAGKLSWRVKDLPSGIYILRMNIDSKQYSEHIQIAH